MTIRVELLGPLELFVEGRPVAVVGRQARAVLVALAVRSNQMVHTDELVDLLWGDHPPDGARHALQVRVSGLRRLVGGALMARPGGYLLRLGPDELDADDFERGAARGRALLRSDQPEAAAARLAEALALWRGEPLADLSLSAAAEAEVARWQELREGCVEDEAEARLLLGANAALVADLEAAVVARPLRERRWDLLMRALYAMQRQGDALACYQRLRSTLRDELGVDPSPAVRRTAEQVLKHELRPRLPGPDSTDGVPPIRFVHGSRGHLAFQVLNPDATRDLCFVPGPISHCELRWEDPAMATLLRRLAGNHRVIVYDKHGTGLSERTGGPGTVMEDVEDLLRVLDAVGSSRTAAFGLLDGAAVSLQASRQRPARITSVVTYSGFPRFLHDTADGLGVNPQALARFRQLLQDNDELQAFVEMAAPERAEDADFRRLFSRYLRSGAGPGGIARVLVKHSELDVRGCLPGVTAPVLVLHRSGNRLVDRANADYLVTHLPHAQMQVLPGRDGLLFGNDHTEVADAVLGFLDAAL